MTLPHQDPPLQKSVLLRSNTCLAGRQVDDLTSSFKSWLISKNYSPATIRNYLADINNFFSFSLRSNIYDLTSTLSSDNVSNYLQTIQKNPAYSRYLSSLSRFFQFAQDQSLISTNPLKAALRDKKPSSDEIINQYSQYLNKKHFSQSTIKNYLNDIKQFIDWNKNPPAPTIVGSPSLEKGGLKTKKTLKQLMTSLFKGGRGPLGKVGLNES